MNKKQALPWDNSRFRNWIAVARACQMMSLTLSRALQGLDLKPPHLDILANVYRYPGISQQDLANRLLVGRSNLSMLLPQLEQRGLIERRTDPDDRRVLRLTLTSAGASLTEDALTIQTEVIERSMSTSSLEECDMVGDVMRKMVQTLTEADPDKTDTGKAEPDK
jgi:MarR family transcriptional regulator, organic hydroperoxide resistance regulator